MWKRCGKDISPFEKNVCVHGILGFEHILGKGCDRSGEQTAKIGTFEAAADRDKRADECGFGRYGCRT